MLELFGMFVLALTPIIWLVIALCGMHMEAYKAAFGAFVVAAVVAFIGWNMSVINIATASLEGVLFALWPIVIVIIAAVFTYNLTVETGAMDVIKRMLTSVSSDVRVLTLLIGWCFGNFLEGMAGFGTAVAIPASMLYALGVNPVTAILVCLIANGVPTMFGSIGIPTTTLATITNIDPTQLAFCQAVQVFPFVLACPILMVLIVGGGGKALKGGLSVALVAGLSFAIPEVLAAKFIGATLPDVVGAVCALIITFIYALKTKEKPVPDEYKLEVKGQDKPLGASEALVAWSPFILIFVVLLLTSQMVPAINEPLSAIKTQVKIYTGDNPSTLTFSWINTPGVLIFICGIVGGLIQHASFATMGKVLGATVKQMSKTILTMLGVLAVAKIMGYSGMIASIAAFFTAALGTFYPIVAPLLGALGTFVTGSGTSSELLFGNVQQNVARQLGVNEVWLVAANSLGTSAGKMLSPQNIAIGCAACGQNGKDGELLGKVAPYAFAYVILMMIEVFVGTLLGVAF